MQTLVNQLGIADVYGINNTYDGMGRLTQSGLATYYVNPLNQVQYAYDMGSERTQQVFTANNYVNYTYDNIGQLKTAQGWEADNTTLRQHEQFGYAYDAAWNLNTRTNNALVQRFGVNNLNELTNASRSGTFTVAGDANEAKGGYYSWGYPSGVTNVVVSGTGLTSGNADLYMDGMWAKTNATLANGANSYTAIGQDTYGRSDTATVNVTLPTTNNYTYDLNGNLLSDGTRSFAYDDENELVSVWVTNVWREDYAYDGMLRRRITKDYTWQSSSWVKTNELHYIYDGNNVVQERDANNLPLITYTRGNDLSHTLQGAGGIGGLLARTDNSKLIIGDPQATAFYQADGNGNIVAMVNVYGQLMAQYSYDPFGNILSMSGPLAQANTYRFSSKEWNENAGIYYYGRRFYDPMLQRWINRDPIEEEGGINLYSFVKNKAINLIDIFGLDPLGHHLVPRSLWNNSSDRVKKVWDAPKNRLDGPGYKSHNGKPYGPKGGNKVKCSDYAKAVKDKLNDFLKSKDANSPEDLSDEELQDFANEIADTTDGDIGAYNAGVADEIAQSAAAAADAATAADVAEAAEIAADIAEGVVEAGAIIK